MKKNNISATDISDGIINRDPTIEIPTQESFHLDSENISFRGKKIFRIYAEGGLTSASWRFKMSNSIPRFFCRMILPTLEGMRKKLLADDKENKVSNEQKKQTLYIEWSGANDSVTVNERPSLEIANLAVRARMENVEFLIQKGYRHFVLFNLPDLSLTPRFQNPPKTTDDRNNARLCCDYFNQQLKEKLSALQDKYPDCTMVIYDAAERFKDMYDHPDKYNFDMAKRNKTYVDSADFKINYDQTSPAQGYMFWNDVHPSADTHAALTEDFIEFCSGLFKFETKFKPTHQKSLTSRDDLGIESLPHLTEIKFFPEDIVNSSNDEENNSLLNKDTNKKEYKL